MIGKPLLLTVKEKVMKFRFIINYDNLVLFLNSKI